MATPYNHKEIEKKWRHNWDVTPINKDTTKPNSSYGMGCFWSSGRKLCY